MAKITAEVWVNGKLATTITARSVSGLTSQGDRIAARWNHKNNNDVRIVKIINGMPTISVATWKAGVRQ